MQAANVLRMARILFLAFFFPLFSCEQVFIPTHHNLQVFNSAELVLKSVSYHKHRSECLSTCDGHPGIDKNRLVSKFNPKNQKCECFESQVTPLQFVDAVYASAVDLSYTYSSYITILYNNLHAFLNSFALFLQNHFMMSSFKTKASFDMYKSL